MHIITYSSQSLINKNEIENQLPIIGEKSQANNSEKGITGALFYKNDIFLQILEGKKEDLKNLITVIKADNRHTNIEILIDQQTDQRTLNSWSMEIINLSKNTKLSLGHLQKVTKSFQKTFFDQKAEIPNAEMILDFYRSFFK